MTGHTEEEATRPFGKKCRGEKRVSFPPDEEMVSGFAESRDTLRDGDSLTLAEIILAYKQSCLKHGVEPNPKTLHQIQEITCLSSRAKCLDLKGVHLDYRSCESLEEILKSVQFNLINLQGAELEENGASSLMEMMLYYESATHLDISSSSSMGVSGWQALSWLLRQSGCLWRLDACNIPLLEFPAQALSKALLSSRLTVLHLENTCLSGKPLFTLVGALKKNAALQELYLCDNELNSYQDAMQLGELLKYNRTLRTIDLGNNAVSDSGLEELCDGLRVEKSGLRTLVLSNNQITHHGMTHLKSVLPFLRTLETLDLSKNNLENQGVHMLKEPLMMNRSITQLSLAAVGITCEGAVVLAEVLAESRVLQTVDVRQNRVLTAGLMALALALRINHSVLRLDLDQNPKEEKDEFLIEIQKTLLSRISELCAANAAASAAVAAAAAAAVAAAEAASEIDAQTVSLSSFSPCDGDETPAPLPPAPCDATQTAD
ncbi:protein phosphatase 1 regulatory subunit 37-like [Astyanax mexicanus]|uniref:Protein phosphatase 1 regulatory subunit 37 n=1 Tax=Astyanax mexicanus TaxID=7994 RepID=A0A8T2LHR2_ASTMX|nr:protein phosphatase 1 regulatory subunit 37-like [Astyanax mexicanus]